MSNNAQPRSPNVFESQPHFHLPSKIWSPEEDRKLVSLRSEGWQWTDISQMLPGRSQTACRLRYKCHLIRSSQWTDERKNSLSREYARLREHVWSMIGDRSGIPWRAAEAMHWNLGEQEISRRATLTSCKTRLAEKPHILDLDHCQRGGDLSLLGRSGVEKRDKYVKLPSIETLFPEVPNRERK